MSVAGPGELRGNPPQALSRRARIRAAGAVRRAGTKEPP